MCPWPVACERLGIFAILCVVVVVMLFPFVYMVHRRRSARTTSTSSGEGFSLDSWKVLFDAAARSSSSWSTRRS